jgi:hypothetical protein
MSSRAAAVTAAYVLVLATVHLTVAAPESCRAPSAAEARAAAAAGAGWLVRHQARDGTYTYLVDDEGRDLGGYNVVRHAGVTLALFQAAGATADDALLTAADRATTWMLDRLRTRGDGAALVDGSIAPLGASALMLAALAERRTVTGDTAHDETMAALGRFLVSMQRANGDFFVSADLAAGTVDRERTSPYFAGEALWALARLHRGLPDDAWQRSARRAAHFVAVERDDRDFVPVGPLNDHWGAYAFAEMADWPLADDVAAYARRIAARFDLLIRWEAQRDAGAPYSWTHGPVKRAAAVGTWLEGHGALARLASRDARLADLDGAITERAACAAGVLVARQRVTTDERLAGAWFAGGESRMDDQQHAISGLLAYADLVEAPAPARALPVLQPRPEDPRGG